MYTISIVSQKGGTGKTTVALSLAVEAVGHGLSVVVADLDPQASACEWADLRTESEPVVLDAQPARMPTVVEKAKKTGVDLLIIDTAGRTEQAALAAARVSDLVVVPLQPSVADLQTVKATLDLVRISGAEKSIAVLTRVKPFGTRHLETIEWLNGLGIDVCPATIGDRVVFQDAFAAGKSVCELEREGKATSEVRNVYLYISKELAMYANKEKAHA